MEDNSKENGDNETKPAVRTAAGIQKMKLERLMKNPDKPVVIPERQKEKKLPHVPAFVRNVMGSSAGAGSGEFHVYRHLRRKEYARQKIIYEKSEKNVLDEEYQKKLEENKKTAEEKTAKKRARRQKKKQKLKIKKMNLTLKAEDHQSSEGDSRSDSDKDE